MSPRMRKRWIYCSFEALEAVNAGSRDPMGADGEFLDEISFNVF
jgi:hypothetical protein